MKIFNKILRKNFDSTSSILIGQQKNNIAFYKIDSLSKSFARNFKNTFESNSSFMKNIDETVKQAEKKPFEKPKEDGIRGFKESFDFEGKQEFRGNKQKEFQQERKPFTNKFNNAENQGEFQEKKFKRKRYDEDGKLFILFYQIS